jgi:hypothetical protein
VDEDIYEMGERKRQLSQAVLSDHRDQDEPPAAGKKGGKGKDTKTSSKEDKEEVNLISQILSKALLRHSSTAVNN